jgi:competence protein ComEA
MHAWKKITKAEIILLVLAALFVCLLLTLSHRTQAAGTDYTITVQHEAALPTGAAEEKVNINTASAQELTALDGIGEVLAGRIVAWRTENGPFETAEDLLNVKGIGEATLENLKDQIIVEEQTNEDTGSGR